MTTVEELIDEVYRRLVRRGLVTGQEEDVKAELLILAIRCPGRSANRDAAGRQPAPEKALKDQRLL